MNVHSLPGASAPKHLFVHTGDGRRDPVTKLVIAPAPFGSWSLVAHFAQPGRGRRLEQASLRSIILTAETLAAQYPEIDLSTGYLSPDGIQGFVIEDHWQDGHWARGRDRRAVDFDNAQALYLHLRSGFYDQGDCWVKEQGDRRLRLYRSHWMAESMTAWEIAEYRMHHPGAEIHPTLEVPAGTCPRCLSRFVAMPYGGEDYHCLECRYEHRVA